MPISGLYFVPAILGAKIDLGPDQISMKVLKRVPNTQYLPGMNWRKNNPIWGPSLVCSKIDTSPTLVFIMALALQQNIPQIWKRNALITSVVTFMFP